MNFIVILSVLAAVCTTASHHIPGSVKFLEEDAVLRRQGMSYSSSVVHDNPNYPDQYAESAVKVDFNTQRTTSPVRPIPSRTNHQQMNYQTRKPKSVQAYTQISQNFPPFPPRQHYAVEEKIPQATHVYTHSQNYNAQPPQSQSFNVGYSVSFTGDSKPQPPRAFSRQRLESAEIITGSRKEIVQRPNSNFEAEEFVNNALIDLKKQKVSGIKPKYHKFPNHKDNDAKNFIGNLAPKTQQYLSYLGQSKPIGSSNPRFRQQLQQQQEGADSAQAAWTNLSPSVEIYHSREQPQNQVYRPKHQERSNKFDHAAALGKSQGFDYTNVLGGRPLGKQHQIQATAAPTPAHIDQNHPSFSPGFPEFSSHVTENSLVLQNEKGPSFPQSFPEITLGLTGNGLYQPEKAQTANLFQSYPELANAGSALNLQIPQKVQDQGVGKGLSLLQTQGPGNPPKLAIDTSLLRDPVLTPTGKGAPNDPHTIAIPFDTAALQVMQQKFATQQQQSLAFEADKGQVQVLQHVTGVPVQQQFHGQLGNLQVQPSLQAQQLQVPTLLQANFQGQGIADVQGQQSQQLNIYGGLDQGMFTNKEFDQYFDKIQPQENRFEGFQLVPPENGNVNRLRPTKDVEMQTDLRPPPLNVARNRRTFAG